MNEEEFVEKYIPSAEDLETAASVLSRLCVSWEETSPWWEKIFFGVGHLRKLSANLQEIAIRRKSFDNIACPKNTERSDLSAGAGG